MTGLRAGHGCCMLWHACDGVLVAPLCCLSCRGRLRCAVLHVCRWPLLLVLLLLTMMQTVSCRGWSPPPPVTQAYHLSIIFVVDLAAACTIPFWVWELGRALAWDTAGLVPGRSSWLLCMLHVCFIHQRHDIFTHHDAAGACVLVVSAVCQLAWMSGADPTTF